MNQNEIATEIVKFKTINGISDNELIKIIYNLDTNFLSKTKGYIDTELIKGKEEQTWIIILHWRTMVEGNEAIKEFFKILGIRVGSSGQMFTSKVAEMINKEVTEVSCTVVTGSSPRSTIW